MKRLAIAVALLLTSVATAPAAEPDEATRAIEDLVHRQDGGERIEAYLIRKKVRRPKMYARLITEEVPADLRKLFAVKLVRESRGRTQAVSRCGCVGPWQTHPRWARIFGVRNPKDPRSNIRLALRVYRAHLAEEGTMWKAVRAYSGGSDAYVRWAKREIKQV